MEKYIDVTFGKGNICQTRDVYQWDRGQILRFTEPLPDGTVVEIGNISGINPFRRELTNNQVEMPDTILQSSNTIYAYVSIVDDDSSTTIKKIVIHVITKPKPADYVYPEEEIRSYEDLKKRMDEFEKSGVSAEKLSAAINAYLNEHPIDIDETDPTVPEWAKCETKPSYTVDEITGAIGKTDLESSVNKALQEAKDSGAFKGEKGEDGKDYVLTEADKQQIAEQAVAIIDTELLAIIGEVSE